VRATPLYSTVLDNYLFKKPSPSGGPEEIGQRFFSCFQLYRLDKQYRSIDSVHSENLESLRTLNPAVYPFTKIFLSQYKNLQPADVIADPEWLLAPVIVLFSKERHALNLEGLKIFATLNPKMQLYSLQLRLIVFTPHRDIQPFQDSSCLELQLMGV
jgi:hypothetical protein